MISALPGQERKLTGRESKTKRKHLLGRVHWGYCPAMEPLGAPHKAIEDHMQLLGCQQRASPVRDGPRSRAHLHGSIPEEGLAMRPWLLLLLVGILLDYCCMSKGRLLLALRITRKAGV